MTDTASAHSSGTAAAVRAGAAMAAAVRLHLTFPGSVSPAEQFHLMITDRVAHDQPHAAADSSCY